jgi:glucose/mannose transport system substrate-binding protein
MTSPTDSDGVSRRRYLALASAIGAAGVAGCAGGGGGDGEATDTPTDTPSGDGGDGEATDTPTPEPSGEPLEIVHWWTAGGEQEAINALLDGFQEAYPEASVNPNPAPGGAGSALDTVIKNRVLNQNPPSTFQIWPGKSLTPYLEGDILNDIGESVWTSEVRDAYLDGVEALAKPDGTYVAVPLNIHRLNNLFYNTSVMESAGVDPSSITDPQSLLDAMETISNETDAAPMAQQTQSAWSTIQLWEDVFVGLHGVDTYMDVLDGNVEANESAVKEALDIVTQYREYFNQDAGSISWDQANSKVINGDAAMIHQGDWAAGQYKATSDYEFGNQWDYVPFPGTGGVYHIVSDSFVNPANNPSPDTTRKFLQYCASVEGQEIFNPIKGSIPPRTDVPTDEFGPFLTSQIEDFGNSDRQPPTIAHGTGVTPEVKSNVEGVFAGFLEQWNVDSAYNGLVGAFE